MRRTKIVATIGPASDKPETIRALIRAGVDVFRMNFSHGTHEEHGGRIQAIREAGKAVSRDVAILQDLCGPKIRVGDMGPKGAELKAGAEVVVTTQAVVGTSDRFTSQYEALPQDVKPGNRILLDDGALELEVLNAGGTEVRCRVVRGGLLKTKKGMNLPGAAVSAPAVTPKDMDDLAFGLAQGVDFVALSFVRQASDLAGVRQAVKAAGSDAQLIAKIERPEAIDELGAILDAADGIMVARGDLGVEMDVARVPILQKRMIRLANEKDKYVITATQMLESMTHSASPTRAEVCDVANAILDGTDAVMLSGETAAGEYPVEAVAMMARIAGEAEAHLAKHRPNWDWTEVNPGNPVMDALGHAALKLSEDLDIKAIAAFSRTGGTALFLSKSRPLAPIIAFTGDARALRRMRLFWGVEPVLDAAVDSRSALRDKAHTYVRIGNLAAEGERFLLVSGTLFGQVGAANSIEIDTVGKAENTVVVRRT